mmetsp:Transcript_31912/g.53631  ORF Transcript_31912/g.53631 Transcript_31912/m.53631 type:complete len:380 (+) Transcript_31912:290-1429(+)
MAATFSIEGTFKAIRAGIPVPLEAVRKLPLSLYQTFKMRRSLVERMLFQKTFGRILALADNGDLFVFKTDGFTCTLKWEGRAQNIQQVYRLKKIIRQKEFVQLSIQLYPKNGETFKEAHLFEVSRSEAFLAAITEFRVAPNNPLTSASAARRNIPPPTVQTDNASLSSPERGSSARSIDYPTPATSHPASDLPPRSVHRDPTRSHPPPSHPPPPVPPPHPQTNDFPDPSLFFQATPGPAFDPFDAIEATPFEPFEANSNALPTPAYRYPASQQVGMQPFDPFDQLGGGAVDPFAIEHSGSGTAFVAKSAANPFMTNPFDAVVDLKDLDHGGSSPRTLATKLIAAEKLAASTSFREKCAEMAKGVSAKGGVSCTTTRARR